jgi:hypothetical protein
MHEINHTFQFRHFSYRTDNYVTYSSVMDMEGREDYISKFD